MGREVTVRSRGSKFEFLADIDGKTVRLGALSRQGFRSSENFANGIPAELEDELLEKVSALQDIQNQEIAGLATNLLRSLEEFERALGAAGPGGAAVLIDPLDKALRVTLRKIKRMNDLIVNRSNV